MTANDMRYGFLVKFDSLYSSSAPNYDDSQISYLLSNAQRNIFYEKYSPQKIDVDGFESSEIKRGDLSQLIRAGLYHSDVTIQSSIPVESSVTVATSQFGVHPKGKFLILPEDALYLEEESAMLLNSLTQTTGGEVPVTVKKHDEYTANIDNPYKKPYNKELWRMDYANEQNTGVSAGTERRKIEIIIPDGYSLYQYRCRYVAYPRDIVTDMKDVSRQVNSILDKSIHQLIIDEAVIIASGASFKEAYQTHLNEKQRLN